MLRGSGRRAAVDQVTAQQRVLPLPVVAPVVPPEPDPISQQLAQRLLAATYRLSSHLAEAEAAERDPEQLQRLFHVDQALTQIRRQAENLHVLTGLQIQDAGRQITTLLDVIRAAASAIEHYRRVRIGPVAELAVAEFAADDVIRVLTELVDNATRFSSPSSPVTVSAHLTEHGTVLLRVEDAGAGMEPARLAYLNAMLAGATAPDHDPGPATRLGLIVVSRLAAANDLRVQLRARLPAGTTAAVLLPDAVLCEIPADLAGDRPGEVAEVRHITTARTPSTRAAALRPGGGLRGRAPATPFPSISAGDRFADDVGAFADGLADAERARAVTPT
jgi:signal transduction histidine kinase